MWGVGTESSTITKRELQRQDVQSANNLEKGILKRKPSRKQSEVSSNIVENVLGKISFTIEYDLLYKNDAVWDNINFQNIS